MIYVLTDIIIIIIIAVIIIMHSVQTLNIHFLSKQNNQLINKLVYVYSN